MGSLLVGNKRVLARTPTLRPLSPLEVNVLAGPETTDVYWRSAADSELQPDGVPVSGYRISVDGEPLTDVDADQRQLRIDDLGFDRERYIGVEALSTSGPSSLPGYRPAGDGEPNSGLRADVFGPVSLELMWDEWHDNIIYRDGTFLDTVDGSSYVDRALEPGTSYRYFVVPFNPNDYRRFEPGKEPYRVFPEVLDADYPVRGRTEEIDVTTASE